MYMYVYKHRCTCICGDSAKRQKPTLPDVTDPFGGDAEDFDWANYDVNLTMSNQSYVTAVDNLPDCIQQWKGSPN